MSPKEKVLYDQLMHVNAQKSQWVAQVYMFVMLHGERIYDNNGGLIGASLVIKDVSKIPLPTPDNPLEWKYDEENDTLTFKITEDKTGNTYMIMPDNSIILPGG